MNDNEKRLIKSFLFFSIILLGISFMLYRKLIIPQQECLVKIEKDVSLFKKSLKEAMDFETLIKDELSKLTELKSIVAQADKNLLKKSFIKEFPNFFEDACRFSEFDIIKVNYNNLSNKKESQNYMDLTLIFNSTIVALKKFTDYFIQKKIPIFVKKISLEPTVQNECRGTLKLRAFLKTANNLFENNEK